MNGSANHTPRKRKCSEYHDPDYILENPSKKITTLQNEQLNIEEQRLQRVREIVEREFTNEINAQQNKLTDLEKNIENAIKLFDKLRYKLVSDYYAKQEIPTSDAEAAQLRGEHTLFQNEPEGAQLPRHPSLKTLINPQRAAARQALSKIDEVTKAGSKSQQKREERRIQKLIREQGIVIDHSKIAKTETSKLFDQEINKLLGQKVEEKPVSSGTALNSARLNNKVKHLIVVGNTSKYIEDEQNNQQAVTDSGQRLTHKWLIYVQAKDASLTPLEKLLKKIRFYLHPSYKPHDIVDIKSPPYQLSRRGWGEFPVRLQLFFIDELQQKPVQLLHNLVLDKTLTGLQTMGAETLVEIWLRPLQLEATNTNIVELNEEEKHFDTLLENNLNDDKLGQFKYDDLHNEDLFEFLNFIDDTPNMLGVDDIEKIQPTVVVNDDANLTSPTKLLNLKISPQKTTVQNIFNDIKTTTATTTSANKIKISPKLPLTTTTTISPTKSTAVRNLFNEINTATITTTNQVPNNIFNETNTIIPNNIENTTTNELKNSPAKLTTTTTKTPRYPQTSKPAVLCLKPQAAPTSTTTTTRANLPQQRTIVWPQNKIATTTMSQTYEKKLVQLVDAQGKVRLVQMLVATKNTKIKPPITPITTTTTTTTTQSVPIKTNSPFVFQKEGKIFIRDPLQNRLKQQQKQQISLLKPQVSLLKPQLNIKSSGIHMSLRETRDSKQDNSQIELSERQKIERLFENSKFDSLASAIEFLLRRLPLILPPLKKHLQAYDFIYCKNLMEFKMLTPMKQRALEWLRAKYINQLVRSHKQLKKLIAATSEKEKLYWSTKEIVIFARTHAYTPSLNQLQAQLEMESEESILKQKIQAETQFLYYNTLTSIGPIEEGLSELEKEHKDEEEELEIDVVKMDAPTKPHKAISRKTKENVMMKTGLHINMPEHLESASHIVEEVCQALGLHLTPAEEIVADVRQPLAKTVLAQCVNIFIEKLVRRAISVQTINHTNTPVELPFVSIQDLAKVIANPSYSDDYDFYNDNLMGVLGSSDQSDKEDA